MKTNDKKDGMKFTFSLPNGEKLTEEEASKIIMTNIIENNIKKIKIGEIDLSQYKISFDKNCIIDDELKSKINKSIPKQHKQKNKGQLSI